MAKTKNATPATPATPAAAAYNYQQAKAEFLSLNNDSWNCLGKILFEELITRLCEKSNNIPDLLFTLMESKSLRTYLPAVRYVEKTLDCKVSYKTIDNVKLYSFTFSKSVEDTKVLLLGLKKSFKESFMQSVFSLVEEKPQKKEFTIIEAMKRLTALQRKCSKHAETSVLAEALEKFIKSLA